MLFFDKFDISSPRRHLSQDRLSLHNLEQELKRRYVALQCIRRGELYHRDLASVFATIYIMLLEDDGRNWEQLLWANLPDFLHKFLRQRLHEGAAENNGWPVESEINTLAIALLWLTMTQDRLESVELRGEIMKFLLPYAFAGFRYPCFMAAESWYTPSDSIDKAAAAPGFPLDRCNSLTLEYYGKLTSLFLPPIAIFAILGYFSRVEHSLLRIPPELPMSRNDAVSRGILHGPTREDVEHFNTQCKTWLASTTYGDHSDGLLKSRRHDPDRRRLLCDPQCDPALSPTGFYIPGTLSGRWQGAFLAPCQDTYKAMLSSPNAPSPFPTFCRFPLYVRFRELYCYCPSMPLPLPEDEGAFLNAYLPVGCHWHESEARNRFILITLSDLAFVVGRRVHWQKCLVQGVLQPSSGRKFS
ncbi:hypothetical protein F5I97DRAFT_1816236 [Phlebopus sp. FC_14]|nr:hypothetical protein F5I97DRAFT_1816236 [Phlebopus sp. FC_14]